MRMPAFGDWSILRPFAGHHFGGRGVRFADVRADEVIHAEDVVPLVHRLAQIVPLCFFTEDLNHQDGFLDHIVRNSKFLNTEPILGRCLLAQQLHSGLAL